MRDKYWWLMAGADLVRKKYCCWLTAKQIHDGAADKADRGENHHFFLFCQKWTLDYCSRYDQLESALFYLDLVQAVKR